MKRTKDNKDQIKENTNITADADARFIELNSFIKTLGLATTGGQAKTLIRSGSVKVNGTVETRNKKKMHDGDIVEVDGKKYAVKVQ